MDPVVRCALWHWRQTDVDDAEAGGLLLGKYFPTPRTIQLLAITSPFPGDVRTRTGFVRRSALHEVVANRFREATDERVGYVGAWHTHPERAPQPSCVDLADWSRAMKEDEFGIQTPIFLIVGTEESRAWIGRKHGAPQATRIDVE